MIDEAKSAGSNFVLGNLNGIASLVVAGYLAAVVYNGNAKALFDQLKTEMGFLEFAVALGIIYFLATNKYTGDITSMFVFAAMLALALKAARGIDPSVLNDFASGKRGLFSTVGYLFGANN